MATIRTPKLINVEYLKAYSSVPLNFNYEEIINYSPIAEQIHILPIIGYPLYDELLDQVENNTLTELNSTLILKIYQVLAPAIVYEALPFQFARLTEVGLQKHHSDTSEAISLSESRYMSGHLFGVVEHQKKMLIEFLEEYKDYYPLYQSSDCSCSLNKSRGLKFLYTNKKYNKSKNIK